MAKWILGFLTIVIFQVSCASSQKYPTSDHFDGKKFHNLNETKLKSFWELMRWQWSREREDWPVNVDIKQASETPKIEDGNSVAITFINHASFLVQTQNTNLLTDPIWSKRSSPFQWAGPKRAYEPGVPFDLLPPIHYVLISHNHYDHMDEDTIKKLGDKFKPQFLVPLGDKKTVEDFGVKNVTELDWWNEIKASDETQIIFVPCQHWSARSLWDKNESLWGSYLILHKGKKIYFAGDTGYADHFKDIAKRFGPVDIALLPIGAYEPRWFMKEHHMNPAEAVQAHLDLQSKKSIGMHFDTFQLADEKYGQAAEELKKALLKQKIPPEKFITIAPGSTIQL